LSQSPSTQSSSSSSSGYYYISPESFIDTSPPTLPKQIQTYYDAIQHLLPQLDQFDFRELISHDPDYYLFQNLIGSGAYSDVYSAMRYPIRTQVGIKVRKLEHKHTSDVALNRESEL
jgi:hypothetical protein